jgi:hypothetical protein
MDQYVSSVCKSAFYHLRNISRIRKLWLPSDFCNSLLYGLPKYSIDRLQSVQNAAARVVTLTRKYVHITPILFDLHWLPMEQRIIFKILLIAYKALHGIAPPYIADLITAYVPKRNLRSATSNQLVVPAYNLRTCGYRSFSCSAPLLWNSLPQDLRLCTSLACFKKKLKTFLFKKAYD